MKRVPAGQPGGGQFAPDPTKARPVIITPPGNYEQRVRGYEAQGVSTSDAQAMADADERLAADNDVNLGLLPPHPNPTWNSNRLTGATTSGHTDPMGEQLTTANAQEILNANDLDWITLTDVAPLRGWRFSLSGSLEHSRGVSWTGTLTHPDHGTCIVENDGDGGANYYGGDRSAQTAFHAAAEAAIDGHYEQADLAQLVVESLGDRN